MKRLLSAKSGSIVAAFLLCPPSILGQGSLTPPPGPPGPTMKTLAQIEPRTPVSTLPFTIDKPGSYYLTTNLTGVAGSHGITIQASDVTLDLEGFALSGVPNALNGVMVSVGFGNALVRNGTINRWTLGVEGRNGTNCRFESLRLFDNASTGLATGPASSIERCNAYGNHGNGITTDKNCSIRDSAARGNYFNGISADSGSQVQDCLTGYNLGHGTLLANDCVVSAVVSVNNSGSGIVAGSDLEITGCKASNNGINGIAAGDEAVLTRCTASANQQTGILSGSRAQVVQCKASVNARGIAADAGSTVRECAAHQNSGDGVLVTSMCVVAGNTSTENAINRDASGIHASGTDNSIKDNTVFSNDWGIRVQAAGNVIIKNTAANNALNYFITPDDQAKGPVVQSNGVTDVTNPLVNLEF